MKPKWVRARMEADRRTEREMLARALRVGGALVARKGMKSEVSLAEVEVGRRRERELIAAAEREAARRRA